MRDVIGKIGSSSPFDELLVTDTCVLALECKMLTKRKDGNPKSFPLSRVTEDQKNGLFEIDKNPISKGFILVNFRWINNHKGKLFALPISEFINLEYALERKSVPLDYFEECTLEIPRYKKGWDLRLLK